MQNIVHKLQNIIQNYYGFASQLDLLGTAGVPEALAADSAKNALSIPLFEPKSKRTVAYFNVLDVPTHQKETREKLRDLIQFSLQNYINLMDQIDVADNLLQYLQMELHPEKIIRLQSHKPAEKLVIDKPFTFSSHEDTIVSLDYPKKALLLRSDSLLRLERLALSLHAASKNHFFLRTDQMGPAFLTALNDLIDLKKTTLFVPSIEGLTERQQKTLETYWLMTKAAADADVMIVAATQATLGDLVHNHNLRASFLKNFDFFYLLSDSSSEAEIRFENLNQCAQAILQAAPEHHLKHHKFSQNINSCHLIPSCQSLFPTLH